MSVRGRAFIKQQLRRVMIEGKLTAKDHLRACELYAEVTGEIPQYKKKPKLQTETISRSVDIEKAENLLAHLEGVTN